jgi:hypothetical protein
MVFVPCLMSVNGLCSLFDVRLKIEKKQKGRKKEKRAPDLHAQDRQCALGHPIDKNLLSTINKNAY